MCGYWDEKPSFILNYRDTLTNLFSTDVCACVKQREMERAGGDEGLSLSCSHIHLNVSFMYYFCN